MSRLCLILGPVLCLASPPAQAACRQALALGLGPVLCLAGPPVQAACRQALRLILGPVLCLAGPPAQAARHQALALNVGPARCLAGPPAQAACRQALGLILGPVLCLAGPPAQAACRQALALGLDISGSVDAVEYGLQREGLARALGAAAVRDALLQQPDAPVRLTVFEWSGPTARTVILPWTAITDAAALDTARARIRTAPRSLQDQTTALGSAMLAGFAMLEAQPDCWTRTLDLSGDGIANTGPRPQDIPASRTPPGVTVNGLTIGTATPPGADDSTHPQGTGSGGGAALSDGAGLAAYFRAFVMRGPGAFVEQATGFDDYAAAMERKLLRELKSLALSDATPARQ